MNNEKNKDNIFDFVYLACVIGIMATYFFQWAYFYVPFHSFDKATVWEIADCLKDMNEMSPDPELQTVRTLIYVCIVISLLSLILSLFGTLTRIQSKKGGFFVGGPLVALISTIIFIVYFKNDNSFFMGIDITVWPIVNIVLSLLAVLSLMVRTDGDQEEKDIERENPIEEDTPEAIAPKPKMASECPGADDLEVPVINYYDRENYQITDALIDGSTRKICIFLKSYVKVFNIKSLQTDIELISLSPFDDPILVPGVIFRSFVLEEDGYISTEFVDTGLLEEDIMDIVSARVKVTSIETNDDKLLTLENSDSDSDLDLDKLITLRNVLGADIVCERHIEGNKRICYCGVKNSLDQTICVRCGRRINTTTEEDRILELFGEIDLDKFMRELKKLSKENMELYEIYNLVSTIRPYRDEQDVMDAGKEYLKKYLEII